MAKIKCEGLFHCIIKEDWGGIIIILGEVRDIGGEANRKHGTCSARFACLCLQVAINSPTMVGSCSLAYCVLRLFPY